MNRCIFTDGATTNNGKKNAKSTIGVYFGENDSRNISKRHNLKQTNQVSELLAIYEALDFIHDKEKWTIYSDSEYSINCITKWHKKWIKNNWIRAKNKPVLNKQLIQDILAKLENKNITFVHVNAHTESPDKNSSEYFKWYGNFKADELANKALMDN